MTEYYCQNPLSRTHGPNVLHWFSIISMGFGWFFGLVWRSWLLVLLDCMMKTLKTPILHNRSFKGPIIREIYKCFLIINCVSELPEKGKHTLNNRSSGVCKVCGYLGTCLIILYLVFFSYLAQSQIRQMDLHVGPYALPHYAKRFRWPHVTRLCSQLWDEAHFLNHISHSVFTFPAVQRDREEEW